MKQITKKHLAFLEESRERFENKKDLAVYANKGVNLIAARTGENFDSIRLYEAGEIVTFVEQLEPLLQPREEVKRFAHDMEAQLQVNDHKGGWKREHHEFLTREISRNFGILFDELKKEDKDKHEITIRCANIANFAMMIADNEGEHL